MTSKKSLTTIDEYSNTFPEDIQIILQEIRQTIQKEIPDATEAISYGIPTFKHNGTNIIFFAACKHYISLYPLPAGNEAFKQNIAHYKKSKGSIQSPLLHHPIPYDIVKQIVTFRLEETL
jgi:uncharacterized protein YdhG (YjbR/CyaY superfamily)